MLNFTYDAENRLVSVSGDASATFTSPDTIVPTSTQGTQAWDRYAFVNNNPVRYNDPTGHNSECGFGENCVGETNPNDPVLLSGTAGAEEPNGVFTEDELEKFGVDCGSNVPQVVCDVYTRGGEATNVHMTITFNDPAVGNVVAIIICSSIGQGCVISGYTYGASFDYAYGSSGVTWNRYAVGPNSMMKPLFLANWSTTSALGSPMAKENFPLAGGPVYGAVLLQPTVKDNTLVWSSTGVGVGTSNFSMGIRTPTLIEFRTKQGFSSNSFISTGTFGINGNVLGTISIWGIFQP